VDKKSKFKNNNVSKKLKDFFKDNIKFSMKIEEKIFILDKSDMFYEIDIFY
jgi:hypothetical protein